MGFGKLCAVALVSPGVGAPAAVSSLEITISLGATHIIGCGGAGIVQPGFDIGHVIVPTSAVRDEGTSYHYLPASAGPTVASSPEARAALASRAFLLLLDEVLAWSQRRPWRASAAPTSPTRRQASPPLHT